MKAKSNLFKKKILAASISSCMLASVGVQAQDDSPAAVEEVQVFGIRASLQSSMNTKRDSAGVVDSITSEDIGKFPDTNLAESLQRITGVSISRVNGEGSEVTVRGFGSEFNLITLNGRQMPGAGVYAGGGSGGAKAANTRSFDFANLASESVSSVDVYKTSKASISTGGMGATINIGTTRPLDNPGLKASIGGKLVHDTTNEVGDDFTPEISGIFSYTDDSDTFGVAVSLSHQVRHSSNTGIDENGWNIARWDASNGGNNGNNLFGFTATADIVNPPEDGQLFGRPQDLRFSASDYERERTNGQVVLQFAPNDSMTATLDYTFAQNEQMERRRESTSWLANGNSITNVVFDNSAVATPILITEEVGPRDQGFEQQLRMHEDTLSSIGLNLEFAVSDNFTVTLDAHDSEMESLPQGPGNTSEVAATIGIASQINHTLVFNNNLPYFTLGMDDSVRGDGDGVFSAGDIGSQVTRTRHVSQIAEVQQFKLEGALEFDNGRFDFGIESRDMENTYQNAQERYMEAGGWGINNIGDLDASLFEVTNFSFDDYSVPAEAFTGGIRGNAEDIGAAMIAQYARPGGAFYDSSRDDWVLARNETLANDDNVREESTALYAQLTFEGELAGMATNLVTGLRYEETDVTSTSLVAIPVGLNWLSNNDFQTDYGSGSSDPESFSSKADYNFLLPSMDFDIELVDGVKARFSYSKSIARAGFSNLTSSVSGFGSGGGSTLLGSTRTADASNPALLPLESDNVDVSVEWYYNDASYASFGVFEKRVNNFIGNENVVEQHFGMTDQTSGPRAEAAQAALVAAGIPVDDTSLFSMMAVQTQAAPAGFVGTWSEAGYITAATDTDPTVKNAYDLEAENADIAVAIGDPVSDWLTNKPVNNREAKIYGMEAAVQHFFGDSGFGVQANYTIVRGDVRYNVLEEPGATQFALLGLSDTANLVAVYDKDGLQARIAYNWRGEYLRSSTQNNDNNPVYVEDYSQIDLNVSYDVNDNISVFVEGLNITGEDYREHQRSKSMINYMLDLGARYQFGARYTF